MRAHLVPFLALVPLAACGGGAADDDVALTTRGILADPQPFAVVAAESAASLHAELRRGDKLEEADVALVVTGGAFTAGAPGARITLDALQIDVGDIALPVDIFPARLILTQVHVHLATPMSSPAYWTDDDEAATGAGQGDLTLDWSLAVDGNTYGLGSQTLTGLGFALALTRDDAGVRLELGAVAEGVMWSWADLVALGDLDLAVTGYVAVE